MQFGDQQAFRRRITLLEANMSESVSGSCPSGTAGSWTARFYHRHLFWAKRIDRGKERGALPCQRPGWWAASVRSASVSRALARRAQQAKVKFFDGVCLCTKWQANGNLPNKTFRTSRVPVLIVIASDDRLGVRPSTRQSRKLISWLSTSPQGPSVPLSQTIHTAMCGNSRLV